MHAPARVHRPLHMVMSCRLRYRVHFADSDQNVYKELRIQELPPPEGMEINEFRYDLVL